VGDLGDPLGEIEELRTRLRDAAGNLDADELTNIGLTVTRGIEKYCHRQFNKTDTATARIYGRNSVGTGVISKDLAIVDDFHTITGLVIATDTGDDGTFATTWTSADYQLEPLSGIVDAETGWPYWLIRAVGSYTFPTSTRRAPLRVTAKWGWNTVPTPVKEAWLVVSTETAKLPEAPFGVASSAEWGVARVRANPMAMAMLNPYRRDAVLVA
jgi:hypothetical protein